MLISDKIALLRKRRGLSQDQLAKEIGVSRQAIYKWEAGITTPDIDNVKMISEFFSISINDLVDDNVNISEAPINISKEENIDTFADISDKNGEKPRKIGLFALIGAMSLVIVALSILLIVSLGKHTHSFENYIVEAQPTCIVSGIERGFCKCGESETRSIATIPHSEIVIKGYLPTCTRIGATDGKKCSICDTVLKEQTIIPVNTNNHTEKIILGTPATCISEGLTDGGKCDECGIILKKQEIIPIGEHAEEIIEGYLPTCVDNGLTDGKKCSVCNAILKEQAIIPINQENHNIEIILGTPATCMKDGLTDGKKCSLCDTILLKQEVIISNGQHIEKTIEGYPSTCINKGLSDKVICSECNIVLVDAISLPLGECTVEEILGYESSCTTLGLTDGKACTVCKDVFVKQEIMKTKPHDYKNGVCSVCLNLEENSDQLFFSLNLDKQSYTAYTKSQNTIEIESLIIPSTYEGYPVTIIDNFRYLKNVSSVIIPNTVVTIQSEAFKNVSSLKKITIPSSVKNIYSYAFSGTSVSSLFVPKTIIKMGTDAFASDKLNYIVFDEGIEEIFYSAFSNCTAIKAIYIPGSIKKLGGAICASSENTTIYQNKNANTSTWSNAWDTCKDGNKCLIKVVNSCPESLVPFTYTLNSDNKSYTIAGNDSTKDEEIIAIPSTYMGLPITAIEQMSFNDHNMRELYIPDTVKVINTYDFYNCSSLAYVDLGNSIESVGRMAFLNSVIEQISFPSSVKYIDKGALIGCNSLKEITVAKGCNLYKSIDGVLYSSDGSLLIKYPCANERTSFNVPNGVYELCENAFAYSQSLTSISLPDNLKSIGKNCFSNCTVLEALFIPMSVETVKEGAFSIGSTVCHIYYGGESIPDSWETRFSWYLTVHLNVRNVGTTENGLKYVITNNNEVTIASGVGSDGKVPSSIEGFPVTVIGQGAFAKFNKSVELPNSIKRIEDLAFNESGITKMILPDGVEYLGSDIFINCEYLKVLYIPNTVKVIEGFLASRGVSSSYWGLHIYYQKNADMTLWSENWNKCNSTTNIGEYSEFLAEQVNDSTGL